MLISEALKGPKRAAWLTSFSQSRGTRCCMLGLSEPGDDLGPLRIGFFYGMVAVIVALVADLRFLFVDPSTLSTWVLAVIETYRSCLALTACLFLGILAALVVVIAAGQCAASQVAWATGATHGNG